MNNFMAVTKRAEFLKTVTAAGTPERLTSGAFATIARVSATRRLCLGTTNANPHGILPGCVIHASGSAEAEFNGAFTVVGVPSANEVLFFTDPDVEITASSATGSPVYYADIWFRDAFLIGKNDWRTANTGIVYIGGQSAATKQPYELVPYIAGGGNDAQAQLRLVATQPGGVTLWENLADYWIDAATNGDGAIVRYL